MAACVAGGKLAMVKFLQEIGNVVHGNGNLSATRTKKHLILV